MKVTEPMLRALRAGLSHPSNLVYAGRANGHTTSASVIKALAARGLVELLDSKDRSTVSRATKSIVGRVTKAGVDLVTCPDCQETRGHLEGCPRSAWKPSKPWK